MRKLVLIGLFLATVCTLVVSYEPTIDIEEIPVPEITNKKIAPSQFDATPRSPASYAPMQTGESVYPEYYAKPVDEPYDDSSIPEYIPEDNSEEPVEEADSSDAAPPIEDNMDG